MMAAAQRFPSSVASCRIRSASTAASSSRPWVKRTHASRPSAQLMPPQSPSSPNAAAETLEPVLGFVGVPADERDPRQVLQRPRLTRGGAGSTGTSRALLR